MNEALTIGLGILGLFTTILISTIGGTATVLWKIAKIDKEKVTWEACQHMRETCPCAKDITELKTVINKKG